VRSAFREGAAARVLVVHHHLAGQASAPASEAVPMPDTLLGTMQPMADADRVRQWCREARVSLVLHGHKHRRHAWREARAGMLIANPGSSTEVHGVALHAFVFDIYRDEVFPWQATLLV